MDRDKAAIRKKVLNQRDKLSLEQVSLGSSNIAHALMALREFKDSTYLMCYLDFRNEVQTTKIIKMSLDLGKKVAVPVVNTKKHEKNEMLASLIKNMEQDLEPGTFGILEPKREYLKEVHPSRLDLVIVPGVAFDIKGRRIGFGAGYYDRFLNRVPKKCLKVGIAFDFQVYNELPEEIHDIPVDMIITESKVLKC